LKHHERHSAARRLLREIPNNPRIRFFTRTTLSQLAASAGFVEIETTTSGMNKALRNPIVATNILLQARRR